VIAAGPKPLSVLLVDHDGGRRHATRLALEARRVAVAEAVDGLQAMRAVAESSYDALLVASGLPLVGELDLCRRLRGAQASVPVALIADASDPEQRVAGLEAGADDFLTRPVSSRELLARLQAISRRTRVLDPPPDVLAYADLRIERGPRRAWRGARELRLTRTEYVLLELLARHPETVLDRRRILLHVWGSDVGGKALAVYIGYVRRKLEADGGPRLIQTVRDVGYVLRAP
jgi:two-component system response regulator MprA